MPWFLVDDDLAFHPKAAAAGDAALGLWTRAGSYCSKYLTEGFVSTTALRQLHARPAQVRALIDAGLWVEVDGGYRFHQWEERQPSREEVEERRRKRSESGRIGGLKSGQTRAARAVAREASASPESKQVLEANGEAKRNPGQARPGQVQTPLLTLVGRLAVSDARGGPPAEQIQLWQDIAGPGVDLEQEARAYLERHLDRPARDERGAWLGWLRRARSHAVPTPRPHCADPACRGGWLTTDPDQPVPCRTCRPHLRATREDAS